MSRPGPSSKTGTNPKRGKAAPPLKDRTSTKLLRLAFTVLLAIVLAVVFIKMVVPDKDVAPVSPDTGLTVTPDATPPVEPETPAVDESAEPTDSGEVVRVYHGQAEEPVDDPKISWEITLEMSDRALLLLEGNVIVREFAGDPPKSDFSFTITPNRYLIALTESETVTAEINDTYNPLTADLFSVNDKGQFFIYLTPKKLSMPSGTLPPRFLIEKENTSLMSMQGFIRNDHKVIGTLHSVFGPNIEYILEPITAE